MRPYFLERMERWADRVFINAPRDEPFDKDERFDTTYGQLHKDTIAIAGWLRSRGVGMGTRVGVVGFNSLEWVDAAGI
jgi:acyl-CoA synthetase (AMP-forming)/AMP-acid ligase II